jgi:N,N'-diacetyllegionaminate synthase
MVALAKHCRVTGIEFLCTPFGVPEVAVLAPWVRRWKVASGCLTRFDLLAAVRDTSKPVILSTGMADMDRIAAAVEALGNPTLLHCTSAYPCPTSEVNLSAMDALRARWGASCPVGYSDHTSGIVIALAAVARGAEVLEKHLTLDRGQEGPDHKSSIEPREFRIMVEAIRQIEKAIGRPEKRLQPSEAAVAKAWYA